MKILLDMNLSPSWCEVLAAAGHEARHWMHIGRPDAKDGDIMGWAKSNGFVLFTHDLDFGAILAATSAEAPSVIQVRTQNPTPAHCADAVIAAIQQYAEVLRDGALVSLDRDRARIRILPLK
jgi:predicted nuclease of predicted toxin-antitoxin system